MKAERFRQIRNLFDAALEREPGTRNEFLREACQGDEELLIEVGKLLAAHGQPTSWIDETILGEAPPRLEGRTIGPYQILRQLGEGGMGAVYLAAQDENGTRNLVALKIVRPEAVSTDILRRFRREREILESLDHPNIARVLGGGMTPEGLPYLVMEFVDGEPIDAYCENKKLDLKARLKLFRYVCSAVQYAHDHHVVHRDLKPSNILVTPQGIVRLLDFGIARLEGSGPSAPTCLTRSDMLLMTPEYASPEQVSGASVTPASDVYALGVVLYELLTGRRPYRLRSRIFHEIVRVICEEAPERPRTADTNVDFILLRALEKDPAQRYPSALQFSEDLRRYGEGLAVEARRHAVWNALGRFAQGNAWWLAALAAIGLAMSTGVVPIPRSVFFAVSGIALVFMVAYYLGSWDRGEDYARKRIINAAKMLPVIAIAMIAEYLILSRLTEPRLFVTFTFTIFLASAMFCVLTLIQWKGRDRLGPVVLELDPKTQKIMAWIAIGILGIAQVVVVLDDGFVALPKTAFLFGGTVPFIVLAFIVRQQIRQRGLVAFGRPLPWTRIKSYSWESGRARLEGKYDVLSLRMRAAPRVEFYVPVEKRPAIEELLKQQLMEWPL